MNTPSSPPAWWQSAVVYQVYPASFADSNGDGMGDLAGITDHVDYLADLGVDVVWLSPMFPTPWADGGYDISDYCNVEPRFGTLADFDALLNAVHERGMKLVLDLVPNHTSDQHPWFVESRSSRENPKRDWYYWQPARDGHQGGSPGAEPTNWRSEFHQSAWQYDQLSGEYYLHLYTPEQPDLNWENSEVRQAIYDVMRWWLERGVDGFRIDVANKVSKVLPFDDVRPEPGQPYASARSQYINGPRVHEYLQEMHREVLAPYDGALITVGETSGTTVADGRLFSDPARHELDMVFTFEHVRLDQGPGGKYDVLPLDLVELKAIMTRWQLGLADAGWNSLYWCNHDQPRVVSRWGDDGGYRVESATLFATLLHLHQGTPYIYQGEELGMTNVPFAAIDDFSDVEALNAYALAVSGGVPSADVLTNLRVMSRDNARSPMQWDSTEHAGFTTAMPWQQVNPNHNEINSAAAQADPTSVWHHYRKLIALRHDSLVVRHGDFALLLADHPTVWAFTRSLDDETLLVLGNVSGDPVDVDLLDPWAQAQLVLANYPQPDLRSLTLRPWESRVYRSVAAH